MYLMYMRSEQLTEWLNREADERGWSYREMARRAGLSHSAVSNVMSGNAIPGWDFCLGISRALSVPPETVFRKAGLLPSLPPAVEEEREVVGILRRLPAAVRSTVVTMLRSLSGQAPASAPAGSGDDRYADNALIPELLQEFDQVPDEWKEEAVRQVKFVARMANRPPAHIIGEEEEQGEAEREAASA